MFRIELQYCNGCFVAKAAAQLAHVRHAKAAGTMFGRGLYFAETLGAH